jgi:ATP-dependent Lon protease
MAKEESRNKRKGLNHDEYQTLLSELFPSKYMSDKIKKKSKPDPKSESESESDYETEEESDSNYETEESDSDYEEDEPKTLNLVVTIKRDEDEDDSDYSTDEEDEEEEEEDDSPNADNVVDKLKQMKTELLSAYPDHPLAKEFVEFEKKESSKYKKSITIKQKKEKRKNYKKFNSIINEKNVPTERAYFMKLSPEEQQLLIQKLESLHAVTIYKPPKIQILESNIPNAYKICALKKINALKNMTPGEGEYYKAKNWIDAFMKIPFGTYSQLPVTINDGYEKCHEFMEKAKEHLDKTVYGLNDAKMQIMQYIGQIISNPSSVGTAIAIKGPMGTGKTTLVKEGISRILQRPFEFIALGGATDSSTLEGHMITYEGSVWGKIVDILMRCKCMNPVIYFDELDKVSDTPKGAEIIGILTHLTDSSQNDKFQDKYFSEFEFDLSKALFIFSYNDENLINPILRDRMYTIQTEGYNLIQKTTIAKSYLLPSIRKNINFDEGQIIITDDAIQYMLDGYTNHEKGVRNLKRCLEVVHTKLNLYRLMKPGTNLFEEDLTLQVSFPFTVNATILQKLIKRDDRSASYTSMYM